MANRGAASTISGLRPACGRRACIRQQSGGTTKPFVNILIQTRLRCGTSCCKALAIRLSCDARGMQSPWRHTRQGCAPGISVCFFNAKAIEQGVARVRFDLQKQCKLSLKRVWGRACGYACVGGLGGNSRFLRFVYLCVFSTRKQSSRGSRR